MDNMNSNGDLSLVACSINMLFMPGDGDRAVQLLLSVVGLTQAKSGCRCAAVALDAAEENRIHYTEKWDSQAAFDRHVASDEFRRVLVAMDLCCEEPQVIVGNLSGREGLAHFQEIRDKQGHDVD